MKIVGFRKIHADAWKMNPWSPRPDDVQSDEMAKLEMTWKVAFLDVDWEKIMTKKSLNFIIIIIFLFGYIEIVALITP